MAIVLQCDCGKTLKVSDDYAGKKARCPGCKAILDIPAAGNGKSDNGSRVEKAGVVSGAKRRPQRDEDDEDDDRPRSRKTARDDDDDDEPRAKKRPDSDDDDDDRPRARGRDRDDEDDDEPRARKGSRDDDDNDRSRKKKKKSKSKVLLFVLLGGGALAFFFVVVAALAFVPYFLGYGFFFLFGGGGLGAEMKYVPDGCKSIESERVAKIRSSSLYKEISTELSATEKKNESQWADKLGVSMDDIERETRATAKDGTITIVTTSKSITGASVKSKSSAKYKESKVGNYTMYELDTGSGNQQPAFNIAGNAFAVPESKIYIEGPSKLIESVLKRDKKVDLPEGMKKAMDLVSFSSCKASASDLSDRTGGDKDVEAAGSEEDFSSEMTTKHITLCKNSEAAEDKQKEAEVNYKKYLKSMEDVKNSDKVIVKTTFSTSGKKLIATSTISASDFKKIMKNSGGVPLPP